MKNFPITDSKTGKEYWISRSMAVVVILTARDILGHKYILAVKRGPGTPDPEYVGKYCLPCGYLDFDETLKEAAARELEEETGISLLPSSFTLLEINDKPGDDKRQNVTFRFRANPIKTVEEMEKEFDLSKAEKGEVSEIKFIRLSDVKKHDWAFNHNNLIKNYLYDFL